MKAAVTPALAHSSTKVAQKVAAVLVIKAKVQAVNRAPPLGGSETGPRLWGGRKPGLVYQRVIASSIAAVVLAGCSRWTAWPPATSTSSASVLVMAAIMRRPIAPNF